MKEPVGTGARASGATVAAATGGLTIERLVAVDMPREFRLHPRDRVVVYTQEIAGARQLLVLSLRAGGGASTVQLTASDKDVSDPQWSPDGRRLAYARDGAAGRRSTSSTPRCPGAAARPAIRTRPSRGR